MESNSGQSSENTDAKNNKKVAVFSYLWILCLIPLVGNKKSKFTQDHARQGFIIFLLSFATIVPFFGQILMIALIITSIIGVLKVWGEESWEIPLISDWSKKFFKRINY